MSEHATVSKRLWLMIVFILKQILHISIIPGLERNNSTAPEVYNLYPNGILSRRLFHAGHIQSL